MDVKNIFHDEFSLKFHSYDCAYVYKGEFKRNDSKRDLYHLPEMVSTNVRISYKGMKS